MIIISPNVVLNDDSVGINGDNPVFGYHNEVTSTNISASSSVSNFPASNLSNNNTALGWRATGTAVQLITVNLSGYTDDFDYVAIARHNLGSSGIAVSVEVATTNVSGVLGGWTSVTSPAIVADDSPLIIRFVPRTAYGARLQLASGTAAARIAVMYVGKLLISQRRIYVGHVPITYGRVNRFVNGVSESANFLGRIKLGQLNQTSVELSHLTPAWVRSYLRPFILATEEQPFFFAWRPLSYPNEVGFCWHTDDVKVSNAMSNGMMQASMSIAGIT